MNEATNIQATPCDLTDEFLPFEFTDHTAGELLNHPDNAAIVQSDLFGVGGYLSTVEEAMHYVSEALKRGNEYLTEVVVKHGDHLYYIGVGNITPFGE